MATAIVAPTPLRGAYPERDDARPGAVERWASRAAGVVLRRAHARGWRRDAILAPVAAEARAMARLDADGIRGATGELRGRLRKEGLTRELVARSFALVREVAGRELGQRHFDVQLVGGWVLLSKMVAEMQTGEGKTLTATLAATTAALAGIPVHVVTVNDYLTMRDAESMGRVYRALGLTVGVVAQGVGHEARQAAYRCDVTYCTNTEVAFDYLRDRIVLERDPSRVRLALERLHDGGGRAQRLLHRGLHYAIVDEADSVLVDEARTPLIISGQSDAAAEAPLFRAALALADELVFGRDVVVDERERSVRFTPAGARALEERGRALGGLWAARRRRDDVVRQALTARHLIHRDRHYLVKDGKVQIVDESTGRLMPERSWERGLHQLLEIKEGCALSGRQESLARISYQRFFRRYLRLAGMTGTGQEVAAELWAVYGLPVVTVPTNRPVVRRVHRDRVYATAEAKWEAVVERVAEVHRSERPVLVGTGSVAASEHLSAVLAARGLPHQVLNARQDGDEAAIVARAGEPGRITVATNMAGRGTDIKLGDGVAQRGGLHVIATERHEAARVDRQLVGRSGRQGDPGSCELVASAEDELLHVHGGGWQRIARMAVRRAGRLGAWGAGLALRRAQRRAERLHARMRADVLQADEQLESLLAFAGRME